MLRQEQRNKIGYWFFRWRSYLPFVLVLAVIPALIGLPRPTVSYAMHLSWEMICLAVSMFGLWVRCYTIGHVPWGTSGRNTRSQVAEILNTSGTYSVTRNPLYLGNFFMVLGLMLFLRSVWLVVIYGLVFWAYYGLIIQAEQDFLRQKFGALYEDYVRRVPAFVPRLSLWHPHALPFSWRNVFKREYNGFFGVILAFFILEVSEDLTMFGVLYVEPVWRDIVVIGLVIYVLLRTLKKKTRLLHVPGR